MAPYNNDLVKGCFGVVPLHVAQHPHNCISNNGLPITHNSVRLIGRYADLTSLSHPNICRYLDIVRGKGELVAVVQEYHELSLRQLISSTQDTQTLDTKQVVYDITCGLRYLHSKRIVNRSVTLQNVLFEKSSGAAKLSNFGFSYLTNGGKAVEFFVGDRALSAPEVLVSKLTSTKSDIWSLAVLLLCIFNKGHLVGDSSNFAAVIKILFGGETLEEKCGLLGIELQSEFLEFLEKSLVIKPTARATAQQLLQLQVFAECKPRKHEMELYPFAVSKAHLISCEDVVDESELEDPLSRACSLVELYELWRMAGGDVLAELEKFGLVRGSIPICDLPLVSLPSGEIYKEHRDNILGERQTLYPISPSLIVKRLAHVEPEVFYPLTLTKCKLSKGMQDMSQLPTVIKERNIEYQLHRIKLFTALLHGYPATVDAIRKEAMLDVPPLLRRYVWSALLEIKGDIEDYYNKIDKTQSLGAIDRQIDVDIPRCHQYNHFLSSPTGHWKLRRVLKAWVIDHPDLTYWQGLDSLAAPFLVLHSGNEALAYASLKTFVRKYVNNFFLKDNSHVMTEYLWVFCQLVMFHDPELALHIQNMGFIPELYAIPWFLTMFTHVFPLQKIFYLWDTMLLGNSSFPMFLGAAVLIQVRETLLSYEFNECILLFSDMPDVDIDKIIKDAMRMYQITPMTLTYRKHSYHHQENELLPPKPSEGGAKYSYNFSKTFLAEHVASFPDTPELKEDICGRIFIQDLAKLLRYQESVERRGGTASSTIVVVDIRSQDVFVVGHLPDSLNVPISQDLVTSDGQPTSPEVHTLLRHRRKRDSLTVVVGPNEGASRKFCKMLMGLHFLHVARVHGGTSALSQAGMLCAAT
ncbi:TBC domain-containing protein kinase-like protein [Bolinopsis microptera]|uniref:TBC domain-containing protein kinase-like protein n=1 Tax=Bolinopsis microptera TaxID=2820187 RepID=UPI00307A6DE9